MSLNTSHLRDLERFDPPKAFRPEARPLKKVLTIFGTRPEAIKLSPVIHALAAVGGRCRTVNVTTAQHTHLLYPLVRLFNIALDYDLQAMQPNQTPNELCSRLLALLDPVLGYEQPDLVLVQGDTTTALAGALAGFHRSIPVAHVEAGLRSGNCDSPYPEEMNRQLITKLATYHFAATNSNRLTLLGEGIAERSIFVTGNPVIDSLKTILENGVTTAASAALLEATNGMRRLLLTTHRRESFGETLAENLRTIRRFVDEHADVALIFPVHPNPSVAHPARAILSGHRRIHLTDPLGYEDFVALLAGAWLIVSDSGGVQEEAPTLGKPLLILRENTERPEVIAAGTARLVGSRPDSLREMLAEAYREGSWTERVAKIDNPFGYGDSGKRIAEVVAALLGVSVEQYVRVS